ncbi:hypothetical protein ACFWCM_12635 [Streptomyces albidoflavus]
MSDTVIRKTPKELHEQRARLIASTGLSEEVLRERGEAFQLYPEHQAVWDTVHGIDYLLDGAKTPEGTPVEEQPALAHVGWYCWRCRGLVSKACRSDNVPVHVPVEWEKSMVAEIERISEDDE